MPAAKKHPSRRQRRNRASTAATLKPRLRVVADYESMTVAQLRGEIDMRNADRLADEQLEKPKAKADLVDVLLDDDSDIPELPERGVPWHSLTQQWWADVWSSPMSDEWHESDIHNVYVCAMLYDDMWVGETAAARQKAAAEFRQQRATLGLSPLDRRRLEWTIESAEEAKDKGTKRRAKAPATGAGAGAPAGGARPDPRAGLSAV